MEITIPWTVKPDGYATKISGQLLHVDASTSLQVINGLIMGEIYMQNDLFMVVVCYCSIEVY